MFRRTPAAPATRAAVEALERRSLLSATIAGAVMNDLSGNGLTADDAPLAGVVVKLYRDVNANGVLDAADGLNGEAEGLRGFVSRFLTDMRAA